MPVSKAVAWEDLSSWMPDKRTMDVVLSNDFAFKAPSNKTLSAAERFVDTHNQVAALNWQMALGFGVAAAAASALGFQGLRQLVQPKSEGSGETVKRIVDRVLLTAVGAAGVAGFAVGTQAVIQGHSMELEEFVTFSVRKSELEAEMGEVVLWHREQPAITAATAVRVGPVRWVGMAQKRRSGKVPWLAIRVP